MSMHSKIQEVSETAPFMVSYRLAKQSQGAYDTGSRKGSYLHFPIEELPTSVVDHLSGFSYSS